MTAPDGVTHWLERLKSGDQEALDRVLPLVYDELRAVAGYYMREERGEHTLSATALVHEAYLRMVKQRRIRVEDRSQFLSVAATMMRRVLVDWARAKKREKRGGGQVPVPLESVENLLSDDEVDEVIALDDALDRLAKVNPRGSSGDWRSKKSPSWRACRRARCAATGSRRERGCAKRWSGTSRPERPGTQLEGERYFAASSGLSISV